MRMRWVALLTLCALSAIGSAVSCARESARERVVEIKNQIQRADYQGRRPELKRLYRELSAFVDDSELASRVRYWRGFALWRRALNGFNESAEPRDLEEDLRLALDEFHKSAAKDPRFVDAKIGALSCLTNLMFLNQSDPAKVEELAAQSRPLLKEIDAQEPDNPRFLWVLGPIRWYSPKAREVGQAQAIEAYQRGLESARKHKTTDADSLDPSWGEPELLMNLAWSNLHKTPPDPTAAEQYARAALEIVPDWRYVRDILIPQIEKAKPSSGGANPGY